MAFRPVIVSCNRHSAGSLKKTYTGSARYICRFRGSGIWSSLLRCLGAGRAVDSKQYIWARAAACDDYVVAAYAYYPRGLEFTSSLRQSDDYVDWTSDLFSAIAVHCFCVSACPSRRRSPYLSICDGLPCIDYACADNSLFG